MLLGIIMRLYTIYPTSRYVDLWTLLVLFLCLVVNIYNIQTPVSRMKYHPSAVCAHKFVFNFNLYAFRGTNALQPNSHMVHNKHLTRARTTKWALERQEIRLINDPIMVFSWPCSRSFYPKRLLSCKGPTPLDAY